MTVNTPPVEPNCGVCAFDGFMSSECQYPQAQDHGKDGDAESTPVTENYGPGCPCFRRHLKR